MVDGSTPRGRAQGFAMKPNAKSSRGVVERTLASIVDALEHAFYAEELAKTNGLLQRIDPRVKIVALLPLVVIAALARRLWVIVALFVVAVAVATLSNVPLRTLAKRVWLGVLTFSGVISLPALFLTPGRTLYTLPLLGWIVTAQGLRAALYLIMRAETAATFSVLLVLCTPWSNLLKALRVLRVPIVLVVILGMTYRYIFLLLRSAHDMFKSRKSRMVGQLDGREQRRAATASAGVLMSKTLQLSGDVYLAMRSRGFQGEVHVLDEFRTGWFDWIMSAVFVTVAALALWFGR
jgi:cobalt/nickel transport system permease protein